MSLDHTSQNKPCTTYTATGTATEKGHFELSQFDLLQAAVRRINTVFRPGDPFSVTQFMSHLNEAAQWISEDDATPMTVAASRSRILSFMLTQACCA